MNNLFSGTTSTDVGHSAENIAADYLNKQGMQIVERNFRSKSGEIDLIALDKATLVFVEVKFRKNADYGQPYEAVTYRKQKKIIQTAQWFLQSNKKYRNKACRFDIISILNTEITWLKQAFE